MSDRRVVITGIGIVSPLAATREATWERLIAGKSGAGRIDTFDPEDMPCKIAFQVPWTSGRGGGEGDPEAFDSEKFVSKRRCAGSTSSFSTPLRRQRRLSRMPTGVLKMKPRKNAQAL